MRKGWLICLVILLAACSLPPRKQIWIVGSSTLYPFIATAAEQFGRSTDFLTPIVEATGTGGGIKLFCEGHGNKHPDIANASRPIKDKEIALCKSHGVNEITEFSIGFDGIVLANLKSARRYHLTREQLFKALAKQIADKKGNLQLNTYKYWQEIDVSLPNIPIEIYGPPPTSGTRDAFVELVMEPQCKDQPAFIKAYPNEDIRKEQCKLLREDGPFIDAGENDNIIVQKLKHNNDALGIFGYSFLEQNADVLQGSIIESQEPTFQNIAAGQYPISRSLFLYIKNDRLNEIAGLKEFLAEVLSDNATGAEGYLSYKGLIPLPKPSHEYNKVQLNNLLKL